MKTWLRHHWELIAAGAAMLALLIFGGLFVAGQLTAAPPAGSHSAAAAARSALEAAPSSSEPSPADSAPGPVLSSPATAASPAQPPISSTTAAGGTSAPPPSVTYPVPAAGSAAYSTKFLASDLTLPQSFTERFTESSPASASLHAFYARSTAAFPALRACLQEISQPACSPQNLPYDSTGHVHWSIGTGGYLLRIAAYSSSQLVGFSLAWTGPHGDSVAGIRIPNSCSSYSAGCGLRFEFGSSGAGTCSVGVSTPLHLRVQQKDSTLAPIYNGGAPASFSIPYAQIWTGQLFSTTSGDTSVSMNITWP